MVGRVLIVDDVPVGIKLLGEFLRQEYEVMVATSGEKALGIAKSRAPELILLDVLMPEMDGFETCRRLKEDPETSSIPVIFLTAASESDDVVRGFEAGGQDYIKKPFKKEEVLARVRTHIELKRAREELVQYARLLEDKNRELEQLVKKVELLAMTDHLTGLCNRRHVLELMRKEVSRIQRTGGTFSVLMVDIDDFKRVNDLYGHEAGDYVLRAVADVIREHTCQHDIVARWGGEEFLVVLPGAEHKEAAAVADRLRSSVQEHRVRFGDAVIKVTLTIGVACFKTGDEIDGLINRADEAMYAGKKQGKNRVIG